MNTSTAPRLKQPPILAPQQRRIRHLSSILARNLTLNPQENSLENLEPQKTGDTELTLLSADTDGSSIVESVHNSRSQTPSGGFPPSQPVSSHGTTWRASLDGQSLSKLHRNSANSNLGFKQDHRRSVSNLSATSSTDDAFSNSTPVHSSQSLLRRTGSSSSLVSNATGASNTAEDSYLLSVVFPTSPATSSEEVYTGGRELLDSFITLHSSSDEPPFYTSEIVTQSLNPSFQALDPPAQFGSLCDQTDSYFVVRLWIRHPTSVINSNEAGGNIEETHRLLIEWEIDMAYLKFIGKELHTIRNPFPSNFFIIGLTDGFYTTTEWKNGIEEEWTETDISVEDTSFDGRIKRSYSYNHIMRLNTLQQVLLDTRRSRDKVMEDIRNALEGDRSRLKLEREKSELENRLSYLNSALQTQMTEVEEERSRTKALRASIEARRTALNEALSRYQTGLEYLEENQRTLQSNKETLFKTELSLLDCQKEIIADLFGIFPIEQITEDFYLYQIRGIPLPNSVYSGYDEEKIASALGYTSHLVHMLASYLGIPLRYLMSPIGSRATVRDPISVVQGSREFPLYSKGVDRYRFEYGVFLLNKNIEQLMNSYGLLVMDLRHTLPNLRYLIITVLTIPAPVNTSSAHKLLSPATSKRYVMKNTISLQAPPLPKRPSIPTQNAKLPISSSSLPAGYSPSIASTSKTASTQSSHSSSPVPLSPIMSKDAHEQHTPLKLDYDNPAVALHSRVSYEETKAEREYSASTSKEELENADFQREDLKDGGSTFDLQKAVT